MQVLIGFVIALFGILPQSPARAEADEMLAQLSKIRLDKKQIRVIRDVTIRRDVLSISLTRGTIAFLEPAMGKVTGAVFIGSGEIVAIPPDAIEKQQIHRFTGSPVLNEPFRTALFRFTDNTFEELTNEIAQHAQEEVSQEEAAQFDKWDQAIIDRSSVLNFRMLADLLETGRRPLFFGELDGDQTGPFNVVFDTQASEEVSVFKNSDLWASFNQRSEARNPEAVAHEKKLPADILSYDIDAVIGPDNRADVKADVRVKSVLEGQRVLTFQLSRDLRLSSVVLDGAEAVSFSQHAIANLATVVLPSALVAGQEITLRFAYSGSFGDLRSWYPHSSVDDAAEFNLTFHHPLDSTLVATGNKMKESEENGLRHSSWKSADRFSVAGFSLNRSVELPAEAPLAYLTGVLGAFPYPGLRVVEASQNAAHNWPMLIELPAARTESMVAQEIARQWFGHKITAASYHDQWLFDGLARYLGAMYVESRYPGTPQFRDALEEARAAALENDNAGAVWLGPRLTSMETPRGYRTVSGKGTWVIHMLRAFLGQDGFSGMMRELAATYAGRAMSTWDFKRLVEKHAGMGMDGFFDQWVFATGIPTYAIDYNVEPGQSGFVVQGTIKQTGVPEGFTMSIPIYADSLLLGRVQVSDSEAEFRFALSSKPERVLIDPQLTVLSVPKSSSQ
jgi:hypothetical protein